MPLAPEMLREYLDFAIEVAQEAGRHTLRYFRQPDLAVELKGDDSPVTIADRETEALIRERIAARWPEHGIVGEEHGEDRPDAALRWIVDPIDGTKSFIHGVPLYTVLLALECDGETVIGVIHNPPLDETVAAATGLGCTLNGEPCAVPKPVALEDARVQCTDYARLLQTRPRFARQLLLRAPFARTWADAYGYLMLVTGRADVMIDPEMSLWDMAALKPIVEEAGGRFTDLAGRATIHADSAIAATPELHEELIALARLDEPL